MSENVSVRPTPIQRNSFDVAIELVNIYKENFGFASPEELESTFAQYYALAEVCNRKKAKDLQGLISDDLMQKLGTHQSGY